MKFVVFVVFVGSCSWMDTEQTGLNRIEDGTRDRQMHTRWHCLEHM
jgi:hypothetical protein